MVGVLNIGCGTQGIESLFTEPVGALQVSQLERGVLVWRSRRADTHFSSHFTRWLQPISSRIDGVAFLRTVKATQNIGQGIPTSGDARTVKLIGTAPRQRIRCQSDATRRALRAEGFTEPGQDLVRRHATILNESYETPDIFCAVGQPQWYSGRLKNIRMGRRGLFHLRQINSITSLHDDIFSSSCEVVETITVPTRDIASLEPSIDKCLHRGGGITEVTLKDLIPRELDFTFSATLNDSAARVPETSCHAFRNTNTVRCQPILPEVPKKSG